MQIMNDFLKEANAYIPTVTRDAIVSFVNGYESGIGDPSFSQGLREKLQNEYGIRTMATSWPGQVATYALREQINWEDAFFQLAGEVMHGDEYPLDEEVIFSVRDSGTSQSDLELLCSHAKTTFDLSLARLSEFYYYQSLTCCLIDSVFSLGIKYTTTARVVRDYCDYRGKQRFREYGAGYPRTSVQETITELIEFLETIPPERAAKEVFKSRNRTSAVSGILKAEAVLRFAKVMRSFSVDYFHDLNKIIGNDMFRKAVAEIPGQASGLTTDYLFMLAGEDDYVKPDRMIIRFVAAALGRKVTSSEAGELVKAAAYELAAEYPNLTPRNFDHEIWKLESGRA